MDHYNKKNKQSDPEADSALLCTAEIKYDSKINTGGAKATIITPPPVAGKSNASTKKKNHENIDNDSYYDNDEENVIGNGIFEKCCFFIGFLFPLAWFIGSSDCFGCRDSAGQDALLWKKRCRIAATLALLVVIVTVAVVMIVNPSMFGLRSGNSSGTQTSSSSDNAIRPGVPLNGTNTWGDTIAGVRPSLSQ
ncbi:hypothetical protein BDC45DRAFT_605541 [Circinella umbellata]|nr:hypothetical protein BDC45DRAFT_605541 [Circinella umbellata]